MQRVMKEESETFEAWVERLPDANPEPTEELFRRALETRDAKEYADIIAVLHARGSREAFEVAKRYTESKAAAERALGAVVLGQLGWKAQPFREERLRILLDLLKDKRATVLHAAGQSLGHRPPDPRVVKPLVALKDHGSGQVRYAVAFGLQGYEDDEAIQALIDLSEDACDDVRDWATTGLAGIRRDTPEIREALARRLYDPDGITAREAVCGLARRGDTRAVEPLLRELRKDDLDSDIVEAAEAMGDRRVQLALRALTDRAEDAIR